MSGLSLHLLPNFAYCIYKTKEPYFLRNLSRKNLMRQNDPLYLFFMRHLRRERANLAMVRPGLNTALYHVSTSVAVF